MMNPNDRCYFVPALSGLGAPYFNGNVRGSILGISRLTGKKEIVRAALDSIAYQVNDIITLIRKSSDVEVTQLCVDGGATSNKYLMQFQADLLRLPLKVPAVAELSGMGAAFMAAIAQGIYSENILSEDRFEDSYIPKADKNETEAKVEGWHKAINSTIGYGI
ncbi:MAG: hypothetical protein J6Z28_03745 [Succinivibrio sp.]|nr:hypothetical protein [Succinivibrio sp.]